METPKEYYYTYYSYEEWGRGYIGSRGCKCLPEEDVRYFGSFRDKTFKPTQKIILKSDYATREEAYVDEIALQEFYKVVENPHFANRAYQTSTKFRIDKDKARELGKILGKKYGKISGKIGGRISGKIQYENKIGMFSLTPEERSKIGKMTYELGIGVHSLTKEQKSEIGKKSSENQKELGIGIYSLTKEQRSENGKKSAKTNEKNKTSIYGFTSEQLSEYGKKGGKKTSSQRWICEETGHISTPGGLSIYQRARGIDVSNRRRIS